MAIRGINSKQVLLMSVVSLSMVLGGRHDSSAMDQDVIDAGKREFQRSCATCHGVDARGNGPAAAALNVKPADLTQLSKQHGGVFLFWRVYEKINGKDEMVIRGHGTREMPIWGERFQIESLRGEDQQMGVRGRILSLVHYLESIQEK